MAQQPAKPWGDKAVPTRGVAIVAAIMSLACCLCCGPILMSFGPSEALAKQFKVPVYPGSTQVGHRRSGGPDSMWEEHTYNTTDSIEQVVAYMDEQMPGFQLLDDQWLDRPYYVNGRSDSSLFGLLASLAGTPGYMPGVGVEIYAIEQEPAITVISVRFDWPAP